MVLNEFKWILNGLKWLNGSGGARSQAGVATTRDQAGIARGQGGGVAPGPNGMAHQIYIYIYIKYVIHTYHHTYIHISSYHTCIHTFIMISKFGHVCRPPPGYSRFLHGMARTTRRHDTSHAGGANTARGLGCDTGRLSHHLASAL